MRAAKRSAGRHRSRWRRLARGVLAAGIGLALAGVAGEILVRVVVGAPLAEREPLMEIRANPHRGWEMVPGLHYTYQHPVQVNALGLRGPELETKREGELRVLMLGDSQLFGQGVASDETAPHFVQEQLRAAMGGARSVTVINAGHRAYDTRQELALLRELGPRIQPDIVIVWFYWNDLDERDIDGTYARLTASGPIVFDVGAKMEGWTRLRWHLVQMVRRSAFVMYLYDQVRALRVPVQLDPVGLQPAYDRAAGYAESFVELSQSMGFRLYYALLPDAASLVGPHFTDAMLDSVKAVLAAKRIATVDLRPPLRAHVEAGSSLPVVPYDFHYDAVGHRVAAQAMVDRLLADGVVAGQ